MKLNDQVHALHIFVGNTVSVAIGWDGRETLVIQPIASPYSFNSGVLCIEWSHINVEIIDLQKQSQIHHVQWSEKNRKDIVTQVSIYQERLRYDMKNLKVVCIAA